jgi:hypothetical protein
MKKLLIFIIVITMSVSIGSPLAAEGVGKDYMTKIATIPLEKALEGKAKEEVSGKTKTPIELVPFVEKDGKLVIIPADALKNIEYADQEMQLFDRKLALYQKQYYASLSDAVRAKSSGGSSDTDMRKREMLNWRVKLNNYENLKYDRADFLDNVKMKFEKNYIHGTQLQIDRDVIKKELEKLEITIKQSKLKLDLGLIKASDMDKLDSTKSQLTAQFNSVQRQLDTIMISIKKSLGIDNSKNITLIATNKQYSKFDDSLIEERIMVTTQSSYDLEKAKKDLDLTSLEYYIVTTYSEGSSPLEADSLETSIEDKEHSLITSTYDREATLRNSYYSLKNLEDNIEIQRLNVKIANQNLLDVKTKVKLNKAIALDEMVATINLSKAENKLQSLINEYMITQASVTNKLKAVTKVLN